ncbi:hypothetical protein QEL93_001571 [Pseudomonas putida]|nr:hypothetical protein [Pseudomonas putida]
MKKVFMALALGLASSSAFAADGKGLISFTGQIKDGGTCPIIIAPIGSTLPGTVSLGRNFAPVDFPTRGRKSAPVNFALEIDDRATACDLSKSSTVSFVFNAKNGVAEGGSLFDIQKGDHAAENIAVAILDRDSNPVVSGTKTADYKISDTEKTFNFSAHLQSTDDAVKPGEIVSEIEIVATII